MMKLSTLLNQRHALMRQTRLANLAYAYIVLHAFAQRIARAGIQGTVILRHAAPDADRYWASLAALDGSQSVIEEHFTDEDLMDLADVLAFATQSEELELTFQIEQLAETFVAPLGVKLAQEGVVIDRLDAPRDALR